MYKTCFLVKGEHSVHTRTHVQTHTHTQVTLLLLYEPHTHNDVPKLSLVTFNTKISEQTLKKKKKNSQWNSAAQYVDFWAVIAYLHCFCFIRFTLLSLTQSGTTSKTRLLRVEAPMEQLTALKCEA